jgi:hypothetical protein
MASSRCRTLPMRLTSRAATANDITSESRHAVGPADCAARLVDRCQPVCRAAHTTMSTVAISRMSFVRHVASRVIAFERRVRQPNATRIGHLSSMADRHSASLSRISPTKDKTTEMDALADGNVTRQRTRTCPPVAASIALAMVNSRAGRS